MNVSVHAVYPIGTRRDHTRDELTFIFCTRKTHKGNESSLFPHRVTLQKDVTVYNPKTGETFVILKPLEVQVLYFREPPKERCFSEAPRSFGEKRDSKRAIICRELEFLIPLEIINDAESVKSVEGNMILVHCKKYINQLQALDENFPSVRDIDDALEKYKREIVVKVLEDWMHPLGY